MKTIERATGARDVPARSAPKHDALKLSQPHGAGNALRAGTSRAPIQQTGYGAVWATENTREAIWDAMQRKETYSTTGSRLVVRFFGGWDFEKTDAETRSPAVVGYTRECRWVEI